MPRVLIDLPAKRRPRTVATALLLLAAGSLAATGVRIAAAAEQTVLGALFGVRDPGVATRRTVTAAAAEKGSDATVVGDPLTGGGVLEVLANGATPSGQSFVLPQGTSSAGKPYWTVIGAHGFQYRDAREIGRAHV